METVISEKCNKHNLYNSVKLTIIKMIIYNNRIPHYYTTKKNDTEQTFT